MLSVLILLSGECIPLVPFLSGVLVATICTFDKLYYSFRYSGGHVFAALTNGTLEIFNRNIQGEWDWDNHRSISIGQRRDFPVLCLLPVNHKIWSGISHTVRILDDTTLKEEHSLQVRSL